MHIKSSETEVSETTTETTVANETTSETTTEQVPATPPPSPKDEGPMENEKSPFKVTPIVYN